MKTTLFKAVTVTIACASLAFFGFAAASNTVVDELPAKSKNLKAEIATQSAILEGIRAQRPNAGELQKKIDEARLVNKADTEALVKRGDLIARELQALEADLVALSRRQIEKSGEARTIRDEAQRLREEGIQLMNQLVAIRSDRKAAEREVQKFKDLLVQAEGMLARAELRHKLLEADRPAVGYDPPPTAAPVETKPEVQPEEAKPAQDPDDAPKN